MKKIGFIISFIWFYAVKTLFAQGNFAFTIVNVIPMNREQVLENQTVWVENGLIKAIGEKIKLPADIQIIEGKGKYLIPGLMDMHAHLYSDNLQALAVEHAPAELKIMLALGTTTVRLMAGNPTQLKLKEQAAKGEIDAPRLFVSSPEISGKKYYKEFRGYEVTNPEKATVDGYQK